MPLLDCLNTPPALPADSAILPFLRLLRREGEAFGVESPAFSGSSQSESSESDSNPAPPQSPLIAAPVPLRWMLLGDAPGTPLDVGEDSAPTLGIEKLKLDPCADRAPSIGCPELPAPTSSYSAPASPMAATAYLTSSDTADWSNTIPRNANARRDIALG